MRGASKFFKAVFIAVALGTVSLSTSAQAASALSPERSERLRDVYLEASSFYRNQLLEFYLPELQKAERAEYGQLAGLGAAATVGTLYTSAAIVMGGGSYWAGMGWVFGSAGFTMVTAAGALHKLELTESFVGLLLEEDYSWAPWAERLLRDNLKSYERDAMKSLVEEIFYLNQVQILPEASEAERQIRELRAVFKVWLTALSTRVDSDPDISLEVENVWHYLRKPTRYARYFRYMSLISYLEAAQYELLALLYEQQRLSLL